MSDLSMERLRELAKMEIASTCPRWLGCHGSGQGCSFCAEHASMATELIQLREMIGRGLIKGSWVTNKAAIQIPTDAYDRCRALLDAEEEP